MPPDRDPGQNSRVPVGHGHGRRGRLCICGLLSLLVFLPAGYLIVSGAGAAERAGPVRIGALTESWGPTPQIVGLRDGLIGLGYRENEQFFIGVRFTRGDPAALPGAARELVQQGVVLIFASDESAAKAAQKATSKIPIVFAEVGDPLGLGLAQSFARPGGNITGVTDLDIELAPKRLEIFREIVPGLKRVLFPYDANDTYATQEAKVFREAARRLGIALVERPVRTQDEAQAAIANVRKGEADGILAPRFLSLNVPGFVLEGTSQRAIPTMFNAAFFVERAGLACYGPNNHESGRQAAPGG